MSEPIQTGHRVYFGNRKMNMEMLEAKPYYVATPGSELSQEKYSIVCQKVCLIILISFGH